MNTVLGVILLITGGQITAGHYMGQYPSMDKCWAALHAQVDKLPKPTEGIVIASVCTDLTDNIQGLHQSAPSQPPKPPSTEL